MEARSNPLPAEKSLQGDRTLVLQDRLVPACRVLSFRSQAAPEGNTLQRKGSLMEPSPWPATCTQTAATQTMYGSKEGRKGDECDGNSR